jgi:hypothetical protein
MCLLLLVLPRRAALLPLVITACYMTFGQQLVLAGLHLTILRMLVVVAYIRVALRQEYLSLKWQRLDSVILLWSLSSIICFTFLWESPAATVNRLGVATDTAGLYFLLRIFVRNIAEAEAACKMFAVLLIPLAACMTAEWISGRNLFHALGGAAECSEVRRGVVRCQGPFAHPILAGTFGAVWVAPCIGLWQQGKSTRILAAAGLSSCTVITLTAGSSGPILTYSFAVFGIAMWIARRHMRAVRWAIVALLLGLHVVMNDPVWFIFARVNVLAASTGWHRANLIDQTIKHFDSWWLLGTKEGGQWGWWAGDITNQYILEAVNGGLVTAALFIAIWAVAFSAIGKAVKSSHCSSSARSKMSWALGCALLSHCVTLLSVSYFDQNVLNLYLLLAMAASLSAMGRTASESVPGATGETVRRGDSPAFSSALAARG